MEFVNGKDDILHMKWKIKNDPNHQPELVWCGSVSKPCTPSVHIKIVGKWMFIPLKMVLIDIDPYPCVFEVIPNYGAEFMILQIRAIPQFRNFPELNFVFQHFQDRKSMKISVHVLFLSCFKQPLSVISDIFRRALNEWPQSHLAANPFSTNMAN